MSIDNRGETDYQGKLQAIATKLINWQDSIVIISHIDPDGDAIGSCLALNRALTQMGKTPVVAFDAPQYLSFLATANEHVTKLEKNPAQTLLVVLDVEVGPRSCGAPLEAEFVINIDHHGTNPRKGDLACVEPRKAATAQMVKDLIDLLPVEWNREIAMPCLTGIITDTGSFRFRNTSPEVLSDAASLLSFDIDMSDLSDQLALRHRDYFTMMGKVMSTVEFPFNGLVSMARVTQDMREGSSSDEDSDDFVGQIRYVEGVHVAILLKEKIVGEQTKISVRSRGQVSAQNICVALGGGGHVPAAGATVQEDLETTRQLVLESTQQELERCGLL